MPAQLAQVLEAVRHSLWFVPAIAVALATALAAAALWASTLTPNGTEPGAPAPLFGGGPEAARSMLQVIAGSVITVAGVTFSITVVALQLASTQYSPRVLRNFLRDVGNQVALAIFIATFTYALIVLQTIRVETDDDPAFVPSVAMTGALGLALLSIGAIVYFIHHISTQIQISSIVEDIADETVDLVRDSWPEASAEEAKGPPGPPRGTFEGAEVVTRARRSGFVQYVAVDRLVEIAERHDVRLRVEAAPGAWIDAGGPLIAAVGSPPDADSLARHVRIGSDRTMQQDASFGVRQLADIAVKALSPGINDPTTATYCIERLGSVLIEAGVRADPPHAHHDDAGTFRVLADVPGYDELCAIAYDQVRHYGGDDAYVMAAVADALVRVAQRVPPHRLAALRRHAAALVEARGQMQPAEKASDVVARLESLTR